MAPTVEFDIGVVMPTMAPRIIDPAAIAPRIAAQISKVFPISLMSTPLFYLSHRKIDSEEHKP
jgi:hypothetical protein